MTPGLLDPERVERAAEWLASLYAEGGEDPTDDFLEAQARDLLTVSGVPDLQRERDESDAESSGLEDDLLSIHDAFVAAGHDGAINADDIIRRVSALQHRVEEVERERDDIRASYLENGRWLDRCHDENSNFREWCEWAVQSLRATTGRKIVADNLEHFALQGVSTAGREACPNPYCKDGMVTTGATATQNAYRVPCEVCRRFHSSGSLPVREEDGVGEARIDERTARVVLLFYAEGSTKAKDRDAGYIADAALRGKPLDEVLKYMDRDDPQLTTRLRAIAEGEAIPEES